MAKRVKTSVEELKSWDEVDRALREIGECEIAIETLEADMNREINDAKSKAEKVAKPLKTAITVLEAQVKAFVEDNKSSLEGKSRDMNFGTVGFRQATSITYSASKTAEILEALKKHGMTDCIIAKESVNKDALKLHTDKEIERVGAKRKTADSFYYDTDRERIRG